jgi:hypothetical protein
MLSNMRAVAVLLMLAVAPIGPTVCELRCAVASSVRAGAEHPDGSRASTPHDQSGAPHDMIGMHHHQMAGIAPGHGNEWDGSAPGISCADSSACPPFAWVFTSAVPTESSQSLAIAQGEAAVTVHLDAPLTSLDRRTSSSAFLRPHSPPIVPLRI